VGREAALLFVKDGAAIVGCDIDDRSGCRALIDLALRTFGHIDVLSNNAAFATFNRIEDMGDEEWDRDRRQVDLVFHLTRAAWPHLRVSRGVLVNTASLDVTLSFKPRPSLTHATSKAGIIGMTRQLTMEGREFGIRANSISPGLREPNRTKEQLKDPAVADVTLFLASDQSSSVTGIRVVVDGV
jgi:NAD(P)-dependent dehydrogenase (short-subunit alcohol dehydrogenase family)